jgi:hypothetical protein
MLPKGPGHPRDPADRVLKPGAACQRTLVRQERIERTRRKLGFAKKSKPEARRMRIWRHVGNSQQRHLMTSVSQLLPKRGHRVQVARC